MILRSTVLVCTLAGLGTVASAQANPYSPGLLRDIRALATAVPGELPRSVGYLSPFGDSSLGSNAVEGLPQTKQWSVTPVFQVRYAHSWIMVDASMDREAVKGRAYDDAAWTRIDSALRGAGLIVITHEHGDHVEPLLHGSLLAAAAPHTLLNRQQVETLLKAKVGSARLDSVHAHDFLVVDYERLLPIGPGVVLIRAPGHTPGSQMIYVRLASGREMVLAGDVAWRLAGVELQRQKPDSMSRLLSEDRTLVGEELAWLKNVAMAAGVTVVISHDGTELGKLARQGTLTAGLDLSR